MLSRAQFLRGALGITGAAVGSGVLNARSAAAAPSPAPLAAEPPSRSYAGSYSLTLDGKNQGQLRAFSGGSAFAELVTEPNSTLYYKRKHIASVAWEPIVLEVGLGMEASFYNLITRAWLGDIQARSGVINGSSATGQAVLAREFTQAMLRSVTFPALDAASKDAAYLTLEMLPESTRDVAAGGKAPTSVKSKMWNASNFRLVVPGLDTSRVSKIDSFTVGSEVARESFGAVREPVVVSRAIEFPNLSVTFSQISAPGWQDWFNDFVVEGNHSAAKHKSAQLSLLAPDMSTELARIDFIQVGICKLSPARSEGSRDQVAQMTAELYCERMEFKYFG